ncbi:MAG: lytic transglycosylase domain-containing protein, partial [Xanthomonadales bacterium]|nr:lytic transglycosylase domain-containing protein [Xanthomonadales bacterium]MBP7419666.1 lytic transglycosylase domain-containing protein [Xanthomonadales bacterium]
ELAARARQAGMVRHLAAYLSAGERADALRWAALLANPSQELGKATSLPDQPRTREGVAIAYAALARRDLARATALWPALSGHFRFDEAQRGEMLAAVALWKAADYAPDAARWLAMVPAGAGDDGLREWRVREAVARADWKAVVEAHAAMTPAQQADPRWRWNRARALELDGQDGAAQAAFESLATEPGFHGFLAADRQGKPYTICPLEVDADAAARARVAALPVVQRAFELHALDMSAPARREWEVLARTASPVDRRIAVALAQERGWLDRGPLTLLAPDDLRYYTLRFPIGHLDTVRARARQNKLDPGLVLGLIRSESAWVVDAHSHADARGLMQVIPSTGKPLARQLKLRYAGPADLFQPHLSIALGTRHLADVIARYDGRVWQALAAYNAG